MDLLLRGEKYNKVVDAWAKCTDRVENKMMEKISTTSMNDRPIEKMMLIPFI